MQSFPLEEPVILWIRPFRCPHRIIVVSRIVVLKCLIYRCEPGQKRVFDEPDESDEVDEPDGEQLEARN